MYVKKLNFNYSSYNTYLTNFKLELNTVAGVKMLLYCKNMIYYNLYYVIINVLLLTSQIK